MKEIWQQLNQAREENRKLREYIRKVEAERDYYQDASVFGGVPNTARPECLVEVPLPEE